MYKNIPKEQQAEFAKTVETARIKDYICPTTAEEYWETVRKYKAELWAIISRFTNFRNETDLEEFNNFLNKKNPKIIEFFDDAWNNAPDDGSIHAIPGWNILCDLCSEYHLINEN